MTLQEAAEKYGVFHHTPYRPAEWIDDKCDPSFLWPVKESAEIIITAPDSRGIELDAQLGDSFPCNGFNMVLDRCEGVTTDGGLRVKKAYLTSVGSFTASSAA